jgi:site-specific recombinase XerD
MKRTAHPSLSPAGLEALASYEHWLREREDLTYDPSVAVKLVGQEDSAPRHFDDQEEQALGYIVKKYAHVAKLTDVSPHDLRHRFGYRMAETVPLHRLAQIMGHDSLDTTKLYIQGTKHDLQQAVETIAWT